MSSTEEKKGNAKGKAKAAAAWEWFKEAAWLQVLLIVGVVVGLVIAIPFVVSAISDAINDDSSDFYENHRIKYSTMERYVEGKDTSCKGVVGNGDSAIDETKDGFVVMYYKENCDNCESMQKNIEIWYKNYNSKYGEGALKFYTIDVGWGPDEDDYTQYEGRIEKYDNDYISLEEQYQVQQDVKDLYLSIAEDDPHYNSSVNAEVLNKDIRAEKNAATLPTPLFVTYTKDKSATEYEMTKVQFGAIGSLSVSSETDVATEMLDIYLFKEYRQAK